MAENRKNPQEAFGRHWDIFSKLLNLLSAASFLIGLLLG